MRNLRMAELSPLVRTRDELIADGVLARELQRDDASAPFRRVRRNRYVSSQLWSDLWPESRHRIEVYAACGEMNGGSGVVSHLSAAAVWELPFYRVRPKAVEFTVYGGLRAATKAGIRRHLDRLEQSDVVVRDGIRCTSLDRTVFDVSRLSKAEVAISCLDAALRSICVDGHEWNADAHARWKERMTARAAAGAGARGIKQARWLIDLADGRAQLPGESVSRLHLERMGFARPSLQVPVPGPSGRTFWIDFGLDEAGVWGEFDGKGKYVDESLRSGRTIEQVLLDEKAREDWVRGTTGRRFARWSDEHIGTPDALRHRLAAFGIHPPH